MTTKEELVELAIVDSALKAVRHDDLSLRAVTQRSKLMHFHCQSCGHRGFSRQPLKVMMTSERPRGEG